MVGGRERCGKVLVVPSQCGPLSSFTLTMLCCVVAPHPVRHANRTKNSPPPRPPRPRPFNSRDRGSLYWSAPVE
jgi:hypothetical protein